VVRDSLGTQKTTNCPLIEGGYCSLVTSMAGVEESLMRKRQKHRESEGVISSPLMMHRLQVLLSRGDSVITSPAARGASSAINSMLGTEGSKLRATLSYEAAV
jgi:hypothetical protein